MCKRFLEMEEEFFRIVFKEKPFLDKFETRGSQKTVSNVRKRQKPDSTTNGPK